MTGLPRGWEWTSVRQIAELQRGVTFKKGEALTTKAPGMVPIIRAGNVQDGRVALDKDLVWVPTDRVAPEQILRRSDIVVATSSGSLSVVGKSALLEHDWTGAHGAFMTVIRPSAFLEGRYLASYLQTRTVRDAWSAAAAGTSINNLKVGDLLETRVPLAPIEEQKRIVAAIEEHRSRLDAGAAALHSAKLRLASMRSSLLEDVTRGEWPCRPLGEILLSLRNGCFVSRPKAEPPGLPILRISAVRQLALDVNDVRFASEALSNATDYQVRPGDILFTRYSGNPDYVGACATVPAEGAGLLHPDKLIRGIPDASIVFGEWIAIAVSASAGRREIEQRLKTTAGQVGIAGSQLKTVPIPLPPLDEQAARIERWKRSRDDMVCLSAHVDASLQRSDSVQRAVLAAAFGGKLLLQDANDEPASVLLEHIRAERAAAPPAKRRHKAAAS